MVAKRPSELAKGMVFAAVVETYAVFGLLATIFLIGSIDTIPAVQAALEAAG
jgi:V/A-type H+-transporting ATPase subunit K